jgi:hypothetical protein
MRKLTCMLSCIVVAAALMGAGSVVACAQAVDRMLAIVDGQVITEGDLVQLRAVAAFFLEDDLPEDDTELLNRAIEDVLVRAQVARFPGSGATEQAIDEFLAFFSIPADIEPPLSTESLRNGARDRIENQRYFRIRFPQSVSEDEIRDYYETFYRPELVERGLDPPLEEIASVVEDFVRLEKMQQQAEVWAATLPGRSEIEIVE